MAQPAQSELSFVLRSQTALSGLYRYRTSRDASQSLAVFYERTGHRAPKRYTYFNIFLPTVLRDVRAAHVHGVAVDADHLSVKETVDTGGPFKNLRVREGVAIHT